MAFLLKNSICILPSALNLSNWETGKICLFQLYLGSWCGFYTERTLCPAGLGFCVVFSCFVLVQAQELVPVAA